MSPQEQKAKAALARNILQLYTKKEAKPLINKTSAITQAMHRKAKDKK